MAKDKISHLSQNHYPLSRMNNNAENNADGQPEYSLFMNKGQRVDAVYYLTKKRVILFYF